MKDKSNKNIFVPIPTYVIKNEEDMYVESFCSEYPTRSRDLVKFNVACSYFQSDALRFFGSDGPNMANILTGYSLDGHDYRAVKLIEKY